MNCIKPTNIVQTLNVMYVSMCGLIRDDVILPLNFRQTQENGINGRQILFRRQIKDIIR